MDAERFDLVFSGELVRGADAAQAKANLGKLFKISAAQVDALFSGGAAVLKKNLDFATANKYRVAIKKAGCRVDLVEKTRAQPSAPPSDPSPSFAAKPDVSTPLPQVAEAPAVQPSAGTPLSNAADSGALPLPEVEETSLDSGLQLAPPGSPVLTQSEHTKALPVAVDTEAFTLSEPGADLLDESEKPERVLDLQIDFDAALAPVGADLLDEAERADVDAVSVDVSQFSLSEPGADLGQIKVSKAVAIPDISHLHIEPN